jgi:hypothetical protein
VGKQAKKRTERRRQHEKQHREARRLADRRLLDALASLGDPLPVAHALASSPMGLHRHLTLSRAVQVALRAAAAGRAPEAASGGLPEILDLLADDAARFGLLEDAQPLDPRLPAVGRFGGHLYRLYPGMLERPAAALRTAELVAIAIDGTLVARRGFGLGDLLTVSLTHMDQAVNRLAPAWPDGDLPKIGTPPEVTPAEVTAAAGVVEWLGLDSSHLHPARSAAALRWATVEPEKLRARTQQDITDTCFGTAMAVAAPSGRLLALPLPYLAEAWQNATGVLAEAAARDDPSASERWLKVARGETARLLDRIEGMPAPHMVNSPDGPVVVLRFGERHLLAVTVAASLPPQFDAGPAARALAAVRPGARLPGPAGSLDVPRDAEVIRLVVLATAGAAVAGVREGVALLTLEDLAWISDTAEKADELLAFCRDLQNPPGGVELFGWEKADTWEWWRANGQGLHEAGKAPDAIYVAPHQVGAEWERAAEQARIERALQRLGIPPAKALPGLDIDGDKVVALTAQMQVWHLTLLGDAVIAATSARTVPDDLRSVSFELPGTVSWVLVHIKDTAAEVVRILGTGAVTVQFSFADEPGDPLRLAGVTSDGRIDLTWTRQLPEMEISAPGWMQRRLGELVSEGLRHLAPEGHGQEAVARLGTQWNTAPPVFALTQESPPQRAQYLHRPQEAPEWARSHERRLLAEHVQAAGEAPGIKRGTAAMTFETEVVAPWLMGQMKTSLGNFSASEVLSRAGAELEAVTAVRQKARLTRQWHPHVWKPPGSAERMDQSDSELAAQRAVLAALLEVTLATTPAGTKAPDDIEWATLLALAELYVQATIRSDGLRWNINGDVTQISESHEVTRASADTPILNLAAFNEARLRFTRPTPSEPAGHDPELIPDPLDPAAEEPSILGIEGPQASLDQTGDGTGRNAGQLADIDPALAEIDTAMREDLGCSAHTLLAVCLLVTRWPVTDDHPTATIEVDDLISAITAELGVSPEEAVAAVEALTLRGTALAAEGVQPWKGRARDHRLLTRPVVDLGNGTIMLLPWNTELSGQVLLQYLRDGLLPWARPRVDALRRVRTALDQLRLRCTRVLEDEIHGRLEAMGFRVRSRVKPHHAHLLGLPSLPGEVDHIAAYPDGDVIWVIEDKDFAEVYMPAEIAGGLAKFYDPGGEVDKLRAKVAAVAADSISVSATLGVDGRPRDVKGLFVTRRPVPAAFVTCPPIEFAVLDDLANVLGISGAST